MEVILKEDVPKLGARGEVVSVAEGYGRNYLLPKKLAVRATEANKAVIAQMKAAAWKAAASRSTGARSSWTSPSRAWASSMSRSGCIATFRCR